jgi:hypothetical protein
MKRQNKNCFTSHFVFGKPTRQGFHANLQFSFLAPSLEHTHDRGKTLCNLQNYIWRLTGLEETKTIFITTANEQQVKIHTFYITIN